jgi:acyl-coenzyme A thioesterase PaaI-like protein
MTGSTVTLEQLERYALHLNSRPSLQRFGVRIWFPDTSRLRLRIDALPVGMRGGMGDDTIVNGGVLSALCDLAIGCTTALVDPTKPSATVQLSIRFEQPLRGDHVEGEGRIDRATKRLVFASADLFDARGEICVRCQGLASLLSSKPTPT